MEITDGTEENRVGRIIRHDRRGKVKKYGCVFIFFLPEDGTR